MIDCLLMMDMLWIESIKERFSKNIFWGIISAISAYVWLLILEDTDSYYSVYVLCAIIALGGVFCIHEKGRYTAGIVVSILIALMVTFANYATIEGIFSETLCAITGTAVFFNSYRLFYKVSQNCNRIMISMEMKNRVQFFIMSSAILAVSYGLYFFGAAFPGNLDTDSFNAIRQIVSGNYSDHHPICFTVIVKLFMEFGNLFSDDINIAIGLYCAVQMVLMVLVISLCLSTMYALTGKKIAVIFLFLFALLPTHIANSVSMWKDIIFSAFFCLYVAALTRYIKKIGSERSSLLLAAVGTIGFCVFRHNGKIAISITCIFLIILSYKNKEFRRIAATTMLSLLVSFLLIGGLKKLYNVQDAEPVDSLSVPLQQISRVLADGGSISAEQKAILSNIVEVDKLPELYINYVSDPIKGAVHEYDNQVYITQHKGELIKVWIQIGLAHPASYIKAWIDLTRGYWNGGYSYFKWANYIKENELGIVRNSLSEGLSNWYKARFREVAINELFHPFISIGIHTWIILVSMAIFIDKREWKGILVLLPGLLLWLTLLIATPLDSETRYLYPVYLTMPIIVGLVFEKTVVSKNLSIK